MIMGATLAWPAITVLGFVLLTAVVVGLGASTTAAYEFERNGVPARQSTGVRHPAAASPRSRSTSRRARSQDLPARPAAAENAESAVRTVVRPDAPAGGTGGDAPAVAGDGAGWWLVDDSATAVAGPFPDRVAAEWAALEGELWTVAVHGVLRADGGVLPGPAPEERAFYAELGDQLERLPRDWDDVLSDTDPLTTLVVEVAAALVEAGLPLHDAAGDASAGGVCLLPEFASGGVLVSWRAHDRMSMRDSRGVAATDTVHQSMNLAIADVLWNLGFVVHVAGANGTALVTALR